MKLLVAGVAFVTLLVPSRVLAQPTIALSSTVAMPGQTVVVTVTGGPGQYFAVIGSSVNSGFSYAGVPLGVGADVLILGMGNLDGAGQGQVAFKPPFTGTILDRYYVQAATSTVPNFIPFAQSAVGVIRNGDLVQALIGPIGPTGPPGPTGATGATGATGQPGPSVGFFALSSTPIPLPPNGEFLLFARVVINNPGGSEVQALCLFAGSTIPDLQVGSGWAYVQPGKTATVPILGKAATTVAAPLSVSCTGTGLTFSWTLAAIRLANIIQ